MSARGPGRMGQGPRAGGKGGGEAFNASRCNASSLTGPEAADGRGRPEWSACGRLQPGRCAVAGCDEPAPFGFKAAVGRWLDGLAREGAADPRLLGRWVCATHREAGERWAARPAAPTPEEARATRPAQEKLL